MNKIFYITEPEIAFNKIEQRSTGNIVKPSSFPTLINCQGSALLQELYKDTDETSEAALLGRKLHQIAAHNIIKSYKENHQFISDELQDSDNEFVKDYIIKCIVYKGYSDIAGVEVNCQDHYNNITVSGITDFFAFDSKTGTLTILDLKTGYKKLDETAKYPLYFYALALTKQLGSQVKAYDLRLFNRFSETIYKPTLTDLIKFKTSLAKKLTSFAFSVGPHCGSCFQIQNCTFALNYATDFIHDIVDLKGAKLEKVMENEALVTAYYKSIKKRLIKKCLDTKTDRQGIFKLKTKEKLVWKEGIKVPTETVNSKKLTPLQAKKKQIKIDKLTDTKMEYDIEITKLPL